MRPSPTRYDLPLFWIPLGLLAAVLLLTVRSEANPNGWEEVFFKANQAYKEGRFHEAIDGYGRVLDSGHENGHLYYNLGQDAISQPKGFMETTFFWLHAMTLHELSWAFAVLNLLFWTVLLVRLFRPSEWTFYTSLILLGLWLLAGASFGVKYFHEQTDDRAVILAEEVDVLAGPDREDTLLFKLHEGAIIFLERSEGGWSLVSLPDNKRGWVQKDALEKINHRAS